MNTRLNHIQNWNDLAQNTKWSVSMMAKVCKVSVRTLQLHFKKQMDTTPKKWLAEHRQKCALNLLRDGSTIKEIAGQLGYKHTTHFSREFKKHWGRCPTQIVSTTSKLRVLV